MAKQKSRSDKVSNKAKNAGQKKSNPFEVKINRQKHKVLGKKLTKFDRGKPGESRSKATKRRAETLLVEYRSRGKTNSFVDRRIGEHDDDMTAEDKMLQRFARERQKHHEDSKQFLLDEEDAGLTHYGQSLSEIERFDDPRLSDSEDEEGGKGSSGNISAKMVASQHFGGFLTRKEDDKSGGGADQHKTQDAKTWKERMEEMIAQSKKAKYDRQHEREMNMEETDKLDIAWKSLRTQVGSMKTSESASQIAEQTKQLDDYDIAVRELKFDLKATATDRMKTEDEIAAEEKANLEKFESDRLKRMSGVLDEDKPSLNPEHKSADDLDDGFSINKIGEDRFHCSYKDGQMLTKDDEDDADSQQGELDEDICEESSDDEVDESSEEGDEDEEEEEEEVDDALGRTSDLDSDANSSDEENINNKVSKNAKSVKFVEGLVKKQTPQEIQAMLKLRKEMMDKARKEIPYTFQAPTSFNDLCQTLSDHSEVDQLTILQRMRKCHHPSLAPGNKQILQQLYSYLLHYYCMLGRMSSTPMKLAGLLYSEIDALARIIGANEAANCFNDIAESMHADYAEDGELAGVHLDTMMMFTLAEKLFCVSDLKHAVTTQTLLFMNQILSQGSVRSTLDIAKGLYICELIFKYTNESKRFVPEALNFLSGVLYSSTPLNTSNTTTTPTSTTTTTTTTSTPSSPPRDAVLEPFRSLGKYSKLLSVTSSESSKFDSKPISMNEMFPQIPTDDDQYKVNLIHWSYRIINKFAVLYEGLTSYERVFRPLLIRLQQQPKSCFKGKIKVQLKRLTGVIKKNSTSEKLKPLTTAKAKPKCIKLFDPAIADSFDGRKQHNNENKNKDFVEKQKLLHKVKKEMKSAVREVKRDNEFLARRKIQDQIEKDDERKTKVKRLYHMLSTQEGEHNAMQRKKSKM